MGITDDLSKAVSQARDPAFRGVLWRAVALSAGLLIALSAGLFALILWFLPDTLPVPESWAIQSPDLLATLIAIPILLILSAFAMFPVAAIFVGLFLDRVADAVEARYYSHLAPNRDVPISQTLALGLRMAGLIILANIVALIAYGIFAPIAPFLYWGLNGYLLGREFFTQVAIRRMSAMDVKALRRAHRGEVWSLGALLAIPMSLPIINLVVPIVGAAAFTHLYHRLR